MRDYEVVYIFRPDLESEEVDERLGSYHDRLGDGEVTAVEHWGQRKLAYEIEDERKGYYVVVQFRAEPSALNDFERGLQHDEDLLRHLIVLSEGELPTPPSQRGEDEEEDEGEPAADEEEAGEEEDEAGDEAEPEDVDDEEESEAEDEDEPEAEDDDDEEEDGSEEEEDEEEAGDEEDEAEDEAEADDEDQGEAGADGASEDEKEEK